MRLAIAIATVFVCLGLTSPAEARGGGRFGSEDKIYKIEPLKIAPEFSAGIPPEWSGGAFLGRRVQTEWFVLGAWLNDAEYVVTPAIGGDRYWSLNAEQLDALAKAGAISSPAPAYKIPLLDYVFGYSLWIVIALLALYFAVAAWVTNLRASGVRAAVGDDFAAFTRLALINAAREDGDVADAELDVIVKVLKNVFGQEVTRAQLMEEATGEGMKSSQLVAYFKMAQGAMTPEQRNLTIHALGALFAADGAWSGKEKRLFQRYVMALGVESGPASRMVNAFAKGEAPA